MEELWQILTADYERTEVKKRMKPICIALEKFGERILTYVSWKKRSAEDECSENFQVQRKINSTLSILEWEFFFKEIIYAY